MSLRSSALVVLIAIFCISGVLTRKLLFYQPEQIHLAYGAKPSEMTVTWVTFNNTNSSVVEYGKTKLSMVAKGIVDKFVDGGPLKVVRYIHRVTITGLTPGQKYVYHCGSRLGWSGMYTFTAMRTGNKWSPTFAVYGDMGNENAKSVPSLQEEAQRGTIDAVLHVGDLAYNMFEHNGQTGDEFMKQIETIAAYVPYMTCVGNHENTYNFSHYVNRFSMPGERSHNNLWYSFDIGPAHIIGFSTEVYFYVEYGWAQIVNQYDWLERDLKEANKPENRKERPWIITMGHRPMYCSNADDPTICTNKDNAVRKGVPFIKAFGLEDLFYKYGVDLQFYAHEHSYERLWPIYDRKVCNGSREDPYRNPPAPVHVIVGSAGCREGEDPFISNGLPWSAFRSDDYGYAKMTLLNTTHLYLEQHSVDKGGAVIDKMMLKKDLHGMGTFTCHKGGNTTGGSTRQ